MFSSKKAAKFGRIIAILCLLTLAFPAMTLACTSIPVSAGASVDGSVMTTHTDDSGTDTFHVYPVPAADWKPGSMRPVIKNTDFGPYGQKANPLRVMGYIPQVAHTYAYMNSSYSFQNEKQVDAYWKLASQLVGRYADGYVYGDDTFKADSVGYPQWWLDAVDFGKSTIPVK